MDEIHTLLGTEKTLMFHRERYLKNNPHCKEIEQLPVYIDHSEKRVGKPHVNFIASNIVDKSRAFFGEEVTNVLLTLSCVRFARLVIPN